MAEETTNTLQKVLLGDTVAEVVDKINAGITNLISLQDGLEDGSAVVDEAINATFAQYDASQKTVDEAERKTIEERFTALESDISNAGAVNDVTVNGKSVLDTASKTANIELVAGHNIEIVDGEDGSVKISTIVNQAKLAIATDYLSGSTFKYTTYDGSKAVTIDKVLYAAEADRAGNAYQADSSTYSDYARYDEEEKYSATPTTIANKYATKAELANAGKVDKIILKPSDTADGVEYTPTNKVVTLDVYTASEVDTKLGNLAGGMRYKGTLGTSGTIANLPTTNVESGDTYKVITAGTYDGQYADIGDLFIATVATDGTITWNLVPSGDDGDVYAEKDFGTTETIIVSANNGTDGKKVKASGKTIVTSIGGSDNVPTDNAVKEYVASEVGKISGGATLTTAVTSVDPFTTTGNIVVTYGAEGSTDRKVSDSGYKIVSKIDNDIKLVDIATASATKSYINNMVLGQRSIRVNIYNYFNAQELFGEYTYTSKDSFPAYEPVCVKKYNGETLIVEMSKDKYNHIVIITNKELFKTNGTWSAYVVLTIAYDYPNG